MSMAFYPQGRGGSQWILISEEYHICQLVQDLFTLRWPSIPVVDLDFKVASVVMIIGGGGIINSFLIINNTIPSIRG